MRSFVGSRVVFVTVVCVIVGSLGCAWGETVDGLEPVAPTQAALDDPPPIAPVPAVQISAGKSANPLWDVPIAALSATRDRPIFSASRRPPPPIAAPVTVMRAPPPPPKEPERPNLQLVGTVIGDEESFGIFVDPSSQTPLRLRLGAAHEGWVLQSVQPRQVMLQKDVEMVALPMPQLGQAGDGEARTGAAAPAPPGGRERMARRAR